MNEARTTWALIVGIDVYDDPALPALQGAVADALAAYRWLRRLGVPDEQILLNASPSPAIRAELEAVRSGCPPARSMDIDDSLLRLEQVVGGTRLFLFLCGHGLYEPTAERLFLTQEFSQRRPANLGLQLYVPRLLEMPFARQFLFMDGCQNLPYSQTERQRIAGMMYGGRAGFDPRPGNGLIACCAASRDQLALEVGGRGLFSRHLFAALDPDDPLPEAVDLDFATGARTVDLRKVHFECVQKKVHDEAWAQTPRMEQTPEIEAYGAAKAAETYPIFRLPDQPTGEVRVQIDPAERAKDLRRVRISAEEPPQWDFFVPRLDGAPPTLPVTSRLPLGLRVTARCSLRPGSSWDLVPGRFDFEVTGDRTLSFVLQPKEPPAPDRESRSVHGKSGDYGATVGGIREERLEALGVEEPEESRERAPAPQSPPLLRIALPIGGSRSLAGFITGRLVVWVGAPGREPAGPLWRPGSEPGRRSLDELKRNPRIEMEPGPARVRLELPWGSWATVVQIPEHGEAMVRLPAAVGTPPLRVALHREARRQETLLLGVEGAAPAARLRRGLGTDEGTALEPVEPGSAAWALRPPRLPDDPWSHALVEVDLEGGRRALFPLMPGRVLALDLARQGLRVEALSPLPSPAWDLLIAAGRLDTLTLDDVVALTGLKWDDWLLGLAGAYAIYARPSAHPSAHLEEVLTNLARLAEEGANRGEAVPDLDLLQAAFRSPGAALAAGDVADHLRPWAEQRAIPVLRWGVTLGLQLLAGLGADEPFAGWRKALAAIEPRLSPISVWTAWTEE